MRKLATTLVVAGAFVAFAAAPAAAESGTYSSTCTNSVTPDESEIAWGITATGSESGGSVVVSGQQWTVTIPGSVFDAGVNLGLISDGQQVNVLADVELVGSNTSEGSITSEDRSLSLTVAVGGDGSASDATVPFDVPDMTFTSTGSPVGFSMGSVAMDVDIGLIAPITFTCQSDAGQAEFLTVGGGDAATTTTAGTATTTTTAGSGDQQLASTGVNGLTLWLMVGAGVVLLDVGYMVISAGRPATRRTGG